MSHRFLVKVFFSGSRVAASSIRTHMSLPQLVQGGRGEEKLGEQGVRGKKRKEDKKGKRRVWEK